MAENALEKRYKEVLNKVKTNKRVPLLKVIRMKCADCTCWQENEIKLCPIDDCVLHPFRFGKHPIKRTMTEAERTRLSERAKKNFKR